MPRTKILPSQLERMVYETLRDEIVSGELPPGAQLVEVRLAEQLGVSKTPVREALIRLQRDGLVEITPYRGARVLVPSDRDAAEITELRICLEAYIAREVAARRPPELIEALERSIDETREALRAGDQDGFVERVREFSDILADACGNERMARILQDLRSVLHFIGNTSRRIPGREERSIAEHVAILAAIKKGDPEAAAEATATHIRSIADDSLRSLQTKSDGAVKPTGERSRQGDAQAGAVRSR